MEVANFLLLRIEDPRGGRAWLRELLKGDLTTAAETPSEERERRHSCLNLAFTWQGLRALGLDEESLGTFPYEFRKGMAERWHVLGDTGDSAPERWEFGGRRPDAPSQEELHVLLMLYARNAKVLGEVRSRERARLTALGLKELYCQEAAHQTEKKNGQIFFREHFGFRDALSQPVIQGITDHRRHAAEYDTPIAAGEFVLGHENEYAEKPVSPTVRASQDPGQRLPEALAEGRKDLGHDGSYLVLRKLEQDVDGFNAFIEQHKGLAACGSEDDEKKKEWLKAKLMGRWPNGTPLKPGQDTQPPDEAGPHGVSNAFRFDADPDGLGCPVTSHVRRTNPRDSLSPGPELSMKVSRRHRILRRGIPYGPGGSAATPERGLLFVALNANLGRQFEFIQQSWVHNEKIGRLYDERDPVASSHENGMMTLPLKPLRRCVTGIQSFVTMKGGGYFFLPGVKALEFLAHLKGSQESGHTE